MWHNLTKHMSNYSFKVILQNTSIYTIDPYFNLIFKLPGSGDQGVDIFGGRYFAYYDYNDWAVLLTEGHTDPLKYPFIFPCWSPL